jgi:hypothetical protein
MSLRGVECRSNPLVERLRLPRRYAPRNDFVGLLRYARNDNLLYGKYK